MIKGIRYYLQKRRDKNLFTSAAISSTDVFLTSFPKSGNTWLRFILARALYDESKINLDNLREYFPTTHRSTAEEIRQLPPPRYIKTHSSFYDLYPRCIYMHRDYRAVAVSAWFHARKHSGYKGTLAEFLKSGILNSFGPWHWHVRTALDWSEKHPDKIFILRYEDLLSDTEPSINRILRYTGISPIISVGEIASKTRFDVLQNLEKKAKTDQEQLFFRAGTKESWKQHLSQELEDQLFDSATKEVMRRCGYLQD